MALFASSKDLKLHENRENAKLASVNFVASSQVSEALAQSGHLALSAPSQIIGQFQYLKTLTHDNLCEYVEIHRGKHDYLLSQNIMTTLFKRQEDLTQIIHQP
ncbi:hypothetical protein BCV72DRAFT_34051 [Rhizopus microsporus var. microsporus]|uniref:Uncharacterized protein n=1 Tax=Rhizopus microsporus var. microsporus TaxID=86635 RepID=A0A1X0QU42_RHIZD|nr:hypothetical protein BCV72DRAFT_34051 [Rhizopus microsporus var. microsporus]